MPTTWSAEENIVWKTDLPGTDSQGENVLLEIDVQGGLQVAVAMPESVRIFVLPPDHEPSRFCDLAR